MPPDAKAAAAPASGRLRIEDATVVVATRTEARAMRRAAPGFRVSRTGIALRDLRSPIATPVVISAGLAGGLRPDTAPGTVVVASEVCVGDGRCMPCDSMWTDALIEAAHHLGVPVTTGRIVTVDAMVTGQARALWARRGFTAVDMESGLLIGRAQRLVALRVVLDTPMRELSPRWSRPLLAALDPRLWSEAWWLLRVAPEFARRGARVLAACANRAQK